MSHDAPGTGAGSRAAHVETVDDHSTRESVIGTDRRHTVANVSWGAIAAGVVTVLAVTVLLSLVTAGIGLDGSGTAAGIWSIVSLALAIAAGGYVAGALAVRGGLIHGFLTWAASLLTALVLATWLSTSLLGAVGGVVGQVTQAAAQATEATPSAIADAVQGAQENVDSEDVDAAQERAEAALEDAQQRAADAADAASTGAWWAFVGLLLGAVIAAVTGTAGARSVATREERTTLTTR